MSASHFSADASETRSQTKTEAGKYCRERVRIDKGLYRALEIAALDEVPVAEAINDDSGALHEVVAVPRVDVAVLPGVEEDNEKEDDEEPVTKVASGSPPGRRCPENGTRHSELLRPPRRLVVIGAEDLAVDLAHVCHRRQDVLHRRCRTLAELAREGLDADFADAQTLQMCLDRDLGADERAGRTDDRARRSRCDV